MDIEEMLELIRFNLKAHRIHKGISQDDLSRMAGHSKNLVYTIEKGSINPTIRTLLEICAALNIDPRDLFEPDEDEQPFEGLIRG